ncbi:MAG TPA: FKBP-type peptidyl-prolyl cis-trans isomerase [Gemmatimonadaceae bacterium]|nr:FKBP-type peptidyl-prolyl cis-trans isomerase [Gemmatimonadaceae bacterium]
MRLSRSLPAVAALVFLAACDLSTAPNVPDPIDPAVDTYATSLGINIASMTKTTSGLYFKDKTVGTGTAAVVNDSISFNYTLWLTNGTQVETSVGSSGVRPSFKIGDPGIIRGFSEGFIGMKPGGVRTLVVPAALGYGSRGKAPVQPNANIIFEIEYITKL